MVKLGAILLAAVLWTPPLVKTGRCMKKPVDPCGCHHVYGVRHCHPTRRTSHCEARAETQQPPLQSQEPVASFVP
ncbi:MAG TPA: hypothetical protein VK447_11060 [Myxococcaceae bacterium]|nr:hypothetical protein [Myxococcaceae bacterium]